MYYFKFYSFGAYSDDTLAKLMDGTIYVPSINQLNDPFEGRWYDNRIDIVHPGADKEFKDALDRRRVFCLCSNDSCDFLCSEESIPMWSHYAASHTGFCVMFSDRILETPGQEVSSPAQVNYCDSMPEKTGNREVDMQILYQKSPVWEYERETRLCFKGLEHYRRIPKESIKTIIAGSKISEMNECLLRGIAMKLGCGYRRLRLDNQSYRFMVDMDHDKEIQ